mmetsp:Transcript_65393/g.80054  ORF Transcript_65393/g.80054 Transcript_65393/m.80054 type:complete len:108 (-) Transcript_65393:35-358(-)
MSWNKLLYKPMNMNLHRLNRMKVITQQQPLTLQYHSTKLFSGHHGPPTRFGFPHEWGAMIFFPHRTILAVTCFLFFGNIAALFIGGQDTIVYPAHKFNNESNMGRNI